MPHPTIFDWGGLRRLGQPYRSGSSQSRNTEEMALFPEGKQRTMAGALGRKGVRAHSRCPKIRKRKPTVSFTVKNTGPRAGTEIAQVYAKLPKGADESYKRLAGWKRVTLAPGESQTVTVAIDPRVLQTFNAANNSWSLAPGEYGVVVGPSSDSAPLIGSLLVR
jgi:hypothetical protein